MSSNSPLHAVLLVAATVAGCDHDVSDADCTPDDPSFEASEACIYGEGLGPLEPQRCEPLLDAPVGNPTFADVATMLLDEERGNCTDATLCHGSPVTPAGDLHFPSEPSALYAALVDTIGVTVRQRYLVPGDPAATWMHCNMRAPEHGGLGRRMPDNPPGPLSDADYELLESWILLGAEGP